MTAAPHAMPTAPTFLSKLRLAAADVKLAHSIFALPFALLGAFLARSPKLADAPWSRFAGQLAVVVLCMVLARTWAMLVNRLADLKIDAADPRTRRRVLASGRLRARDGTLIAAACAIAFVACCSLFWICFANSWPLALSLPVLAWIAFYSFTKRFTALCHIFLGGALAASPIAAAIAINPASLTTTPAVWFLAGFVLLWVAGFDVIYALQDIDFDRAHGLNSIPARLGWRRAIWASRLLHVGSLAMLALGTRADARLGPVFFGGVALVAALLVTEHVILARRGQAGLDMAFFTINGVVSCVLGVAGILDLTVL